MQAGNSFPLIADNGMGAMKSEGAMATWGFKVWKADDAEVKWAGNSEPMMWGIMDFPTEGGAENSEGEVCNDLNNGAGDNGGDGCDWYKTVGLDQCGLYDTDSFDAFNMCCTCHERAY